MTPLWRTAGVGDHQRRRAAAQVGAAKTAAGASAKASSIRTRVCGAIGSARAAARSNQPSRSTSSPHGRSAPPTTSAAKEMPT